MSLPLDVLIELLMETGVVPNDELVEHLQANDPGDALALVRGLIEARKLTRYQAFVALHQDVADLVLGRDGRYIILERLGEGAAGEVFKTRHEILDRISASKVIKSTAEPHWRSRFRQEIRLAAKLVHPNIVAIHDAREHNGRPFLVMEYVEGGDLERRLRDTGPFEVGEAIDYVRQTAHGLAYAHARSIIHRDIKPKNLMVTNEGQIKILDFGLANSAKKRPMAAA